MSKWLFFVMLIATSRLGFGQRTNTSEQVDSLLIQQYVENSGAILDSLTRYEFAKLYIKQYQLEIASCKDFRQQLLLDNAYLSGTAAALNRQGIETELLLKQMSERYRKANRERWFWRVVALTGSVLPFLIFQP